MRTVLVVADRQSIRDSMGPALEEAGYEVLACPGPRPPGYVCVGGRGGRCPLAAAAEAVVVDCDLASDGAMMGTPYWELIEYYRRLDLPVVALAGWIPLPDDEFGEGTVILPRTSSPDAVVTAISDRLS
jgi:CheY-like chemotaxis protein